MRRDLPWRATRDPWAVLVSELMLQQTQVARVVPRWEAFLARFPSAQACAAAPVAEVVQAWAGLGYNRRALNLHRSAQTVVDRHDSEVPRDLEALLALPGVGPYTARAVLVFAFEQDVGLVDTNAGRFLARAAMGRTLARGEAQSVADGLVPEGHGWAWGQAGLRCSGRWSARVGARAVVPVRCVRTVPGRTLAFPTPTPLSDQRA